MRFIRIAGSSDFAGIMDFAGFSSLALRVFEIAANTGGW
jgi:hypothetical protein